MDGKNYLELTKQYQIQKDKSYQKPYQKQQHEQHHEQTLGNEYSKKIPEKPLIAEEIDALFWGKLVRLGWRIDDTPLLKDTNSKTKVTRLIYVCPDCDIPLHAENALTVTPTKAKMMCDALLLNEKLFRHQKIAKDCRPIDDEAESKAIPEATSVFEKPTTGRLRIDTIDGETKAFNGERWVSIS